MAKALKTKCPLKNSIDDTCNYIELGCKTKSKCDFTGKDHGLCDHYQNYQIDKYTEDYGEEEHTAYLIQQKEKKDHDQG